MKMIKYLIVNDIVIDSYGNSDIEFRNEVWN